jgi:hypothetical protein
VLSRWRFCFLLAALAPWLAGCGRPTAGTRGPTLTTADGTRIEVAFIALTNGFTYEHREWPDPLAPAERLLPRGLGKRLGLYRVVSKIGEGGGGTNLYLVTVLLGPPGGGFDLTHVRIHDETGRETVALPDSTLGTGSRVVRLWSVPLLPQRAQRLTFTFLAETTPGSWTNLTSFTIPNPLPPRPEPAADALPVTRAADGLAVTLEHASLGHKWDAGNPGSGLFLRFATAQGGRPVDHWRPERLDVLDPLAGPVRLWGEQVPGAPTNTTWRTFFGPWADETWRLRLRLSRTADFASEELWTSPLLELPGGTAAVTNLPSFTFTLDGVTARLHSLTPPRGIVPEPLTGHWRDWHEEADVFSLWLQLDPPLAGQRITLVRAEDEAGRTLETRAHGWWTGAEAAFGLRPAGGRAVRLTFALHRSRFVEFNVRLAPP